MTTDQANQLLLLFNAGYKILVNSPHVDGFVTAIYEKDGVLTYDSIVWNAISLEREDASSITCYTEENWQELKLP